MIRRAMWTAVTYAAGMTTSVYLQRKLRRRVKRVAVRYGSNAVIAKGKDVAGSARYAGREVKAALREGRETMRETEGRLRHEHGLPAAEIPAKPSPPAPSDHRSPRARGRHRRSRR